MAAAHDEFIGRIKRRDLAQWQRKFRVGELHRHPSRRCLARRNLVRADGREAAGQRQPHLGEAAVQEIFFKVGRMIVTL